VVTTTTKQGHHTETKKDDLPFEERSEELYNLEKCFLSPSSFKPLPTYRVMDTNGIVINSAEDPQVITANRLYKAILNRI
jgi:hypothetical protein